MKIRTQFIFAMLLFGIVLITIAASIAITNARVSHYNEHEEIANSIERSARELSYTSNSYLLYGESQLRTRWESTFAALSADIARLGALNPEEQVVVDNIETNMNRLQAVFIELSTVIESKPQTPGISLDPAFIQVAWSRMEVQGQSIVFDADRLYRMFDATMDRERNANNVLIGGMVGIFGVYLLLNYMLVYLRALKSVAKLKAGAEIIGAGNLAHVIVEKRNDEIGELAHAFNRMTSSLKEVTASKSELEREIEERKKAEEAIRKQEEKFRIVSDFTHDWEYWRSPDNNFIYVSPSCEQITGYTVEEFMGNPNLYLDIIHSNDRKTVEEHLNMPVGRDICELEFRIVRRDGEERWMSHVCQPVVDKDGRYLGRRASNRDVTERKKTEEKISASETRYRRLFESAKDGILILDFDTGKVVDVNPFLCDLLGYSSDEFLGKALWEIGLFKDIASSREAFISLQSKGYIRYEDLPLETRGEQRIEVEFVSNVYLVNHTKVIQCNVRDITERKRAEAEIAHLASFPALNPNPVLEMDSSGKVIYMNPAAVTSFPNLPAKGKNHPFLADWESIVNQLNAEKLPSINRDVHVGDSWYMQTISHVPSSQSYRIYARDVTERTKAEEGLFQRNRETSALLEAAHTVLRIKEFKEAAQAIFNDCKELIGATSGYVALLSKDGTENEVLFLDSGGRPCTVDHSLPMPIRGLRGDAYRTGQVVYENDFARSDWVKLMPAGHVTLDNVLFSPLVIDGKVMGLLGLANKPGGFTENDSKMAGAFGGLAAISLQNSRTLESLESSEQALRKSEAELSTILASVPVLMMVLDEDRHVIKVNDTAAKFANSIPEEMAGLRSGEAIRCLHSLDDPRGCGFGPSCQTCQTRLTVADTLETGNNHYQVEWYIPIRRNGKQEEASVLLSTVLLDTEEKQVLLCIEDISEIKKAEDEIRRLNEGLKQRAAELEAANYELESFSYSVSHDLRAPLRSMEGFSQALREDYANKLDATGKDYLKRVQDSAVLMAQLIDDLLKLSKVTRGEMQREDVNLSELAESIVQSLKAVEPERKVTITITPEMRISGDTKLLRVALDNLIGNAWKFTSKTPQAKIEVGMSQHNGKTEYFVRDNGAGFDMAYANKLFAPFQRLHKTNEFPGTGIGLATVQRIIHRHGGKIRVEAEVGKGATFYFTIS